MVVAWLQVRDPDQLVALGWVNIVLGAWLIAGALRPPRRTRRARTAIHWNDIVTGVGVLWFSIWSPRPAP